MCVVLMAKFHELRYELLPDPPYSPHLAPSDYFLFSNLKKWLGEKRFYSNDEIISQTNTYFEDLDKFYFLEGIQKLEKRWTEYIQLEGDCTKKKITFIKKPSFDLKCHALIDPPSYILDQ